MCPEGQFLRQTGSLQKERGLVSRRYLAQAEDCRSCARKPECSPENRSGGRGILRWEESAGVLAFRQKMETEEARASYRRRGRVVEFCHAWIKSKLGLRQFHVRGLIKVQMEMLWACLTYNLQPWIRLRKPLAAAATG
jgi:Transposase DDE domain